MVPSGGVEPTVLPVRTGRSDVELRGREMAETATSGRGADERRLPARRSSMSYLTSGNMLVTFLIAARRAIGVGWMPSAVAWPACGPASSTISVCARSSRPSASAKRRSVASSGTASATTIVGGWPEASLAAWATWATCVPWGRSARISVYRTWEGAVSGGPDVLSRSLSMHRWILRCDLRESLSRGEIDAEVRQAARSGCQLEYDRRLHRNP